MSSCSTLYIYVNILLQQECCASAHHAVTKVVLLGPARVQPLQRVLYYTVTRRRGGRGSGRVTGGRVLAQQTRERSHGYVPPAVGNWRANWMRARLCRCAPCLRDAATSTWRSWISCSGSTWRPRRIKHSIAC